MSAASRPKPRVLVVEDDPSMRLFVAMALETFEVELVECARVAQATLALQQAPADLVLCDLNLPDECGLDLIDRLAGDAALRADARIVCFSGRVDDAARERLSQAKVWRILPKPCPLATLEACVSDALAAARGPAGHAPGSQAKPQATALNPRQQRVVAQYFEGDATLYQHYLQACLEHFPVDLRAGDAAVQDGDLTVLHRLGHSLKTVLMTLGDEALSHVGAELERCAAGGDTATSAARWNTLSRGLRSMLQSVPH